ncbi:hypothetical protein PAPPERLAPAPP_02290 [Brevundimonas phage vB_BpoS-Papperlapapp]|uniref:Uncharacterized protein n=2 Tax=Marchewkavirus TaxID=3425052 RepID=A0A9E7MPJ0_9CAUD|nr:hypothetical protein KABACHOK_00670 [Brevundimonas phage vB_BpoS-Kabachok]USN14600.1 hypothetical protein DOMOVOI_01260 [Brevundimonas phage vB_BpoS-Domovoi]USN15970.1 hypothetical protein PAPPERLAPAPP_02290 [Brevundimonas phage vB_BpoS-Papperlapapp]
MIRYATEKERLMFQAIYAAFGGAATPGYIDGGHFDGITRRPGYSLSEGLMQGHGGLWTYREPDGISNHARFWFHPDFALQYDPEAHIAGLLEIEYRKAQTVLADMVS